MNEVKTVQQDQTLSDVVRENAVDQDLFKTRRRLILFLTLVLAGIIYYLGWRFLSDRPVHYTTIEDHYKYGSIGAEPGGSLTTTVGGILPPYGVFKVLPGMFPDLLPDGYESLGFIYEEGHDLPIGVSRRKRLGMDLVGFNCAVCHTGTVRKTLESEPQILLGMPAHSLDLQGFTRFLIDAVLDPRFTPDNLIGHMEKAGIELDLIDLILYQYVLVPQLQTQIIDLGGRIRPILNEDIPAWGLGRVDTFNPYKSIQFNWDLSQLPPDELIGAADYPSIWWQAPRDGMQLHWDGNNSSLAERNLSASLGAGVTPVTIDIDGVNRVRDWIMNLKPPPYPFAIDQEAAKRGSEIFARSCVSCHGDHRFGQDGEVPAEAPLLGKVIPIQKIQTDPFRLNSYTPMFAANQYGLYPDSEYSFTHFRKTDGYANHPLDGIWARAPYLHNGSVPTLRSLLNRPEARPKTFYRGNDVFHQEEVGFVYDQPSANGRKHFLYDTSVKGNYNTGHIYGTQLSDIEKDDLVQYLKTF